MGVVFGYAEAFPSWNDVLNKVYILSKAPNRNAIGAGGLKKPKGLFRLVLTTLHI